MRELLILLILWPVSATAQQNLPVKLNELTAPKAKTAAVNPDYIYTEINDSFFGSRQLKPGLQFLFETEPGVAEEFIVTRVARYTEGTVSIAARKPRELSSEFMLTYSDGKVIGQYYRSKTEHLRLGYQQETESNYITSLPTEDRLPDYGGENLFAPRTKSSSTAKQKSSLQPHYSIIPHAAALADALEDSTTIDVMIVYTTAAKNYANSSTIGSLEMAVSQAMNLANIAHDNSKTGINMRLVHSMELNYTEAISDSTGETDSHKMLNLLTEGTGVFEAVHTARNTYGADLVALFAKIEDTGGLGWILDSTAGAPDYGFSINRIQQVPHGFTLAHELGHNMGSNHSQSQNDAEAPPIGGLFHYSTGYQDLNNGYATIMAYPDGLTEVPYFSSPDLYYNGIPLGTNHSEHPENNARSMKEIKRVVAGYYPTKINPPALTPLSNSITVEMNREDMRTIPVTLANTGASSLMWSADFDFPDNIVPKTRAQKASGTLTLHKKTEPENMEPLFNIPVFAGGKMKNPAGKSVLYETSFESGEGFSTGGFEAKNGWRLMNRDKKFQISAANPRTGSRHLRLESKGDDKSTWLYSPFFGLLPFGSYEIEMDISLTGTNALNERFDFYIYDDATNELTAGMLVVSGALYTLSQSEGGSGTFSGNNTVVFSENVYKKVKIIIDNDAEKVEYRLTDSADNSTISVEQPFVGGRKPGSLAVIHGSAQPDASLDIDNFKITKKDGIYPWLDVERYGGSAAVSGSETLNLIFDTRGMSAGNYYTKLIVQTNDPQNMYNEIPVHLKVGTAVGNEETAEGPKSILLGQNYPNPFNPQTTFSYTLKEAAPVKIDVFTIHGQKVATLVNTKKEPGVHTVTFNAENLSSGVYLYRLQAQGQIKTRKMVLVK